MVVVDHSDGAVFVKVEVFVTVSEASLSTVELIPAN
jgi:hypothetical protein